MHVFVAFALLNLHLGARIDYAFWADHPGCPEPMIS